MSYVARHDRPADKAERYAEVEAEILAVLDGESNRVARMATVASMLADAFPPFFWTGFYVVDPDKADELVVGPYQGTLGCLRIAFGRGVCGSAAVTRQTQIVTDVQAFAGHIACDPRSASEIVTSTRAVRVCAGSWLTATSPSIASVPRPLPAKFCQASSTWTSG